MSTTFRPYAPDQSLLLPPDVREWLPEGHLAHHISDLVDDLDLTAFYAPYEGDGRRNAPYEPRMMVKVLLYAYATGVFSSRRVARRLEEDVAFRVLAAGNFPQHRTLCEFRRRHLEDFQALFVEVVRLAQELGLARLGKLSIDGTKVRANASKRKAMSYDRMQEEEQRLESEIEALLRKADAVDEGVRLFFVEKFSPYSWAFLPADASLQCSVRGDSNQASTYPRLSGGQPSLETVPNTVGLSPSGALPSGHSRGVLVRFHGQGDRPVMAVTTGFQGRRFDVPEARTGVPRIDLPSPAPCAAADAVFADAKAFLSSNEARQMSESELERELHRRGQKLVRKLLQGHHDQRSPGQAAGPAEDASGVECSAWREHDSHAETTSGTMQVVGLGCARRGHDGLHPLDAALNLLPERSLVDMRRRVTIATASRAPPRTPWKPQWYSTLSTWQRRCGVRCSSPAP